MANYKYNIFLSYPHENKDDVMKMASHLTQAGLTAWKDTEEMQQGNIDEHMMNGILNSQVFLACISTKYKDSPNCMKEFNYAIETKKAIVYIFFDKIKRDERINKLGIIGFHMARQYYYKPDNVDQIIKKIKDLLIVSFITLIIKFIKFTLSN
jgi:hypothetical protein